MTLSFLLVSAIILFAGQVRAASFSQPSFSMSSKDMRPVAPSIRLAQAGSSMENWQGQAFTAIELQKRLDNLARIKKKQIIRYQNRTVRNNRIQRSAIKRQKKNDIRQKQALAKERQRNKLRLRRSIQQTAARLRAKKQLRKRQRSRVARNRRNEDRRAKIVTEPVRIQKCLKRAGYFKGVITGRLDDATLLAFLSFRDDKNLQSRPHDLYDPKSQEVLFSLCPERNLNSLTQIVANSLLGRKPVFVTSVRQQQKPKEIATVQALARSSSSMSDRKNSQRADNKFVQGQIRPLKVTSRFPSIASFAKEESVDSDAFAVDVLAATDKSEDRFYSSGKKDRLPSRSMVHSSAGEKGATSFYAMKRTASARTVQPQVIVQNPTRVKLASLPAKVPSLFSRKLSISDLAMIGPSNRNTCSPQTHEPALAMSTVPIRASRPMQMARNSDEAPLTTGAISSSYLRKALRNNVRRSSRLVQRVKKEKTCLPQDLYDLLLKAHGSKKDLVVCKKDCLPAPAVFSPGQKELFAEQYKINWCGTGCLGLADPLPLKDVMQIEREARVHVCMTPQTKLSRTDSTGLDAQGINRKIRALYEKLPGGYGNDDNIAVLIGNKNYARKENGFGSAHLNVAAMKALLLEQLGYRRENIIVVKDATRTDLVRLFGRNGNADGELKRRLSANPNAQLMIYYSGHASSSGLGMSNYLLPVDAISGVERKTSYSLNVLYDNLRELDARTTQLFLDASFNADRGALILAPNISERRVNIAPIVPVRGLAIYTASTGDQKPLVDPETGLGMFTRFLIGGLAGTADKRPIGNGDRVIDSVELYVHLAAKVRLAARKTLGLKQNPTLSRTDNLFLSQLSRSPRR
ncbi:MAG: caspase family protein [Hyphomicrobiaceae bacterium]|nr:caspase family protein [Hyphomicrobiaceae bacterium]